jgi:hypothetical protein
VLELTAGGPKRPAISPHLEHRRDDLVMARRYDDLDPVLADDPNSLHDMLLGPVPQSDRRPCPRGREAVYEAVEPRGEECGKRTPSQESVSCEVW